MSAWKAGVWRQGVWRASVWGCGPTEITSSVRRMFSVPVEPRYYSVSL